MILPLRLHQKQDLKFLIIIEGHPPRSHDPTWIMLHTTPPPQTQILDRSLTASSNKKHHGNKEPQLSIQDQLRSHLKEIPSSTPHLLFRVKFTPLFV